MNLTEAKAASYEEIRRAYKIYLQTLSISEVSIVTYISDAFYLWRKCGSDAFWNVVTTDTFEIDAKETLTSVFKKNSSKEVTPNVNGYIVNLRRFRKFLSVGFSTDIITVTENQTVERPQQIETDIEIPNPSALQVEHYLAKWDNLENYHLQENALDRLFNDLCPANTDISDVLLKASTLNNFYSTNIYSIFPVAKHIVSLDIDDRLKAGDINLVTDIQHVMFGEKGKSFYSFATKYCSHHNPLDYPIYDSYVDEVLRYFRNKDNFASFTNKELKDYSQFKRLLINFRAFYDLDKYNLKQIDKYLWQLGKEYIPRKY